MGGGPGAVEPGGLAAGGQESGGLAAFRGELEGLADPERAAQQGRVFKAGQGEYAEGDRFLGVPVPQQRKLAGRYGRRLGLGDLEELLESPWHECRLSALLMMVRRMGLARTPEAEKDELTDLYRRRLERVNNWDLVDSSAHYVLGRRIWETGGDRSELFRMAESENLWVQRAAVMATFWFIRQGEFADTLALAEKFLDHPHDLIHKAVGWMLREVGNRDGGAERAFLERFAPRMPRTMLRYAVEKFPAEERRYYRELKPEV